MLAARTFSLSALTLILAAFGTLIYGSILAGALRIGQRALRRRVEVAHDGISIRGGFVKRLIPIADIVGAIPTSTGVELELSRGKRTEIVLGARTDETAKEAHELVSCIDEARRVESVTTYGDHETLLAKGDREREAWEEAARAIGSMAGGDLGGYRRTAMSREMLWDILENGRAGASAREGAAIALSMSLDATDRKRLRRVARRTVLPSLSARLETLTKPPPRTHVRVGSLVESPESDVRDEAAERSIHALDDLTDESADHAPVRRAARDP